MQIGAIISIFDYIRKLKHNMPCGRQRKAWIHFYVLHSPKPAVVYCNAHRNKNYWISLYKIIVKHASVYSVIKSVGRKFNLPSTCLEYTMSPFLCTWGSKINQWMFLFLALLWHKLFVTSLKSTDLYVQNPPRKRNPFLYLFLNHNQSKLCCTYVIIDYQAIMQRIQYDCSCQFISQVSNIQ